MEINCKMKIIIPLVTSLLITVTFLAYQHDIDSGPYKAETYPVSTGYGYFIEKEGIILIKQDYIPAIEQKQAFISSQEAEKIASTQMEKIRRNENPAITVAELKDLKITIKRKFPEQFKEK